MKTAKDLIAEALIELDKLEKESLINLSTDQIGNLAKAIAKLEFVLTNKLN